jgi:hypothetical protein
MATLGFRIVELVSSLFPSLLAAAIMKESSDSILMYVSVTLHGVGHI